MCGITGVYRFTSVNAAELEAEVKAMTDCVSHRGPDSSGIWVDGQVGVGLGHRRLAIRDLSPTGHQPMVSSCQRFVIAYNGEV